MKKIGILLLVFAFLVCGCSKSDIPLSGIDLNSIAPSIYTIGTDINPGKYFIKNESGESSSSIIVFASKEDYEKYKNSNRSTLGEESTAIEQNAIYDAYIDGEEKVYYNFENGNVLFVEYANCKMEKITSDTWYKNDDESIVKGLYVAGRDIETGNISLKSNSMTIATFENKDNYLKYYKSNRFTNGEDADAIDKYAINIRFIYNDYSFNLKDNYILLVKNGKGTLK